MNKRELYRPLTERTLENYQLNYLARKYDFGKESRIACLIISEINRRMDKVECELGIKRVRPFELYVRVGRKDVMLPLFKPEYLNPIYCGDDFSSSREIVVQECLKRYRKAFPRATKEDLLSIIDPWSLVRAKHQGRYEDEIRVGDVFFDKDDPIREFIEKIKPEMPTARLGNPDVSAPAFVVRELIEFVSQEAGLGRRVSRELVEEVITLRNVCCPRITALQSGQMPMIITHVNAHVSEETRTKFRRLAPVCISVWTKEELENCPRDVHGYLELLKKRIVRACFEAYRQNGLLTLMELQWVFHLSSARVSELIRSFQKEHNIIVPTPGTILDSGRSMTHKDIIVGLHLQGYDVKQISQMTIIPHAR
jgi:hypothetical protein